MGLLSGLFSPSKNTNKGFKHAINDLAGTRKKTEPFLQQNIQSGSRANTLISDLLGANGRESQQTALDAFLNSPAFDFNFKQGQRAIEQGAAARGLGQSGANLKDLQEFGQGLQANEFNNRISQLFGLNTQGFQGANQLTNNSLNQGNLFIGRGQAQDAGNREAAGNVLGIAGTLAGFGADGGFGRRTGRILSGGFG